MQNIAKADHSLESEKHIRS